MEEIKEMLDEPIVQFKSISQRDVFRVFNEEIEKTLVEISGYDLQFDFNLEYLNSVQDVEAAIEGLGNLFRDIIMERLLERKNKPPKEE